MAKHSEHQYLQRCIELASEAVEAGDAPFGTVLVSADGKVLFEERNRVVSRGDQTYHPEFEVARWAARNLSVEERAKATVYTSGEHCPMCSAAHGWARLGRIVYITSGARTAKWAAEFGAPAAPIHFLPIHDIVPDIKVEGPIAEFVEEVHELHRRAHQMS